MRLRFDPRLSGRPGTSRTLALAQALLLLLVAVQAARLLWILVTPLHPFGDYRRAAPAPGPLVLDNFDPFARLASSTPAAVTALDLQLRGVREDRATGRGSAIIALPDGTERSFSVGEPILPGVILEAVSFDSVAIRRGGVEERIFLDQAGAAPAAAPSGPAVSPTPSPSPAAAAPAPPAGPPLAFAPRLRSGRVDGIAVSPGGDGQLFRAAGFAPGDVIVAVNGRPVTSIDEARALLGEGGGEAAIIVERAGRRLPMRVRLGR